MNEPVLTDDEVRGVIAQADAERIATLSIPDPLEIGRAVERAVLAKLAQAGRLA